MSELLNAALAYAERGWHVFPIQPKGKRPLVKNGFKAATTSLKQIRKWWIHRPNANIGISLDHSGLCVLDVDVGGNKQGEASLAALEAEHGSLPPTLVARTGGGGIHLVFATDEVVGRRINFRPGLDLLTNGYILAAPSVHKSGKKYTWTHDLPVAPLPECLKAVGKAPKPEVIPTQGYITAGGRHNAMVSLGGTMRDRGMGRDAIEAALHAENLAKCSPPLDHDEIVGISSRVSDYKPTKDVGANEAFAAALGVTVETVEQGLPKFKMLADVAAVPKPPVRVYPTGNEELDILLGGGYATRQLAILMARPGAGKSALAIANSLFIEKNLPVLYVSTELEGDEIAARVSGNILKIAWRDIVRGRHERTEWLPPLDGLRFAVIGGDEIPRDSKEALECISDAIDALTAEFEIPPLVIVDFLQDLFRGQGDERSRIGNGAVALLRLAQIKDCSLLAVSSTSRASYGANAQALRMADDPSVYLSLAKESGDIDYAAAVVMFLDIIEGNDEWRLGRIAVSKCRHGQTGFVGLKFHGASGRFESAPEGVLAISDAASGDTENVARLELFRKKVLDHITSPNYRPVSKTNLKTMIKGKNGYIQDAIDSLITDGTLVDEPVIDDLGVAIRNRRRIVLAPCKEPDSVADALAKALGVDC